MISLRRSASRHHLGPGNHDLWLTFQPKERLDQPADEFGALVGLEEMRFPPGEVASRRPREETEIITYVHQGALAQEDSTGRSGVVHAGEFQRMIIGSGVRRKEKNASSTDQTHVFRISLHPPEAGLGFALEQRRFAAAQRHNLLCVVASPDGRRGSLRVVQDALVFSSVLDPGHHLIHELEPERSAWLHVICGEVILQDLILTQGDGVGVTIEPSVSFTAQDQTEVLLVDLGPQSRPLSSGAAP
jgi:redox-sensitive bicupin YhaK (pirin superfamily)